MSTYRVYKCNLCEDILTPSTGSDIEGFGIQWSDAGQIFFKYTTHAETHICRNCAEGVHQAFGASIAEKTP